MKRSLFTLIVGILFITSINSQTLVSTEVLNKNIVIEEYTGIHCGYCPEGHVIAQGISDENPNRVVLINIHTGSFATPGAGEPDFRTTYGTTIASDPEVQIDGYPNGSVNRHFFSDLSAIGGTSMSRGAWTTAASRILAEESPVNVGASTTYNSTTRELTVNVELYYTADSDVSSNFINVVFLQNNVLGPQTGGGMGDNYVHNYIFRDLLTGQWGEEITTTTEGTFIERTYTYTVPADFIGIDCIVDDCNVAVLVTEDHQEVLSATVVPAIDGTTLVVASIPEPANTVLVGSTSNTTTFSMDVTSNVNGDEDFLFTLSKNDQPTGWDGSFFIKDNLYPISGTISLTEGEITPITIDVSVGADAGFAKYTLTVASLSTPNAPAIIKTVYVIANTRTLIVNNHGSWSGGSPADLTQDYIDALDYANARKYTSCNYTKFMAAVNQEKLSSIVNIFYNIAWTFPSFTNENVIYFSNFLDNGGNLFVAGQDVGWDTWDTASGGNGTTETQAFYTNYLNADYQGDGSSSNSSINSNTDDDIFGTVGTSTIVNIYGGSNMYPDELDAIGDGQTIFYYNGGTTKSSAVKSSNGTYKTVFLGFDPSMISDVAVRNDLLKVTYDWFMEGVSVNKIKSEGITVYPNPAKKFVTIDAPINSKIEILDITGKVVMSKTLSNNNQSINIENLNSGIYIIHINSENNFFSTKLIIE